MAFLGGFCGAFFGCLAIGFLFVIIGGAKSDYPPEDKE